MAKIVQFYMILYFLGMGKLIISGPSLIIVYNTILLLNKLAGLFVLGSAPQVFSDVIIVEQALVGN